MDKEKVAHDLALASLMLDIKNDQISYSHSPENQIKNIHKRYEEYLNEALKLV